MQLKHRPQEDHADLGLVFDDNTEETRKPPAIDTVFEHRAAEGLQELTHYQKGSS